MGRDGMGCDEMGRDRTGRDGTGWDGMGNLESLPRPSSRLPHLPYPPPARALHAETISTWLFCDLFLRFLLSGLSVIFPGIATAVKESGRPWACASYEFSTQACHFLCKSGVSCVPQSNVDQGMQQESGVVLESFGLVRGFP